MRVIIFDLDYTLAPTGDCQIYLTSQVGRDSIVPELQAGRVGLSIYDPALVHLFNELVTATNCIVVVVSDSPKGYCVEVLNRSGYTINSNFVFGAQGKPTIDIEELYNNIAAFTGIPFSEFECLVIGDSPKDIYMAHAMRAPSVFVSWGSQYVDMVAWSRPTYTARNTSELREAIVDFFEGNLRFIPFDFSEDYITLNLDQVHQVRLSEDEIGYGREYVPDHAAYRNATDRYASRDLHWIVKRAKNYTSSHHMRNLPIQMYGADGIFDAGSLKSKAGHFKREFIRWCESLNISGDVLLIPVPSSVPRECNLSFTMKIICEWWTEWINSESRNIRLFTHDVFERYLPRKPSHLSDGRRESDEHFSTLGVFDGQEETVGEVDYVIIVDDVVTSGAHMNAIASFIRTIKIVEDDADILGYALFKTVHPE